MPISGIKNLSNTANGLSNGVVAGLLQNYNECNSPEIDVLPHEPTSLQFMKFVARNRPFVIRG